MNRFRFIILVYSIILALTLNTSPLLAQKVIITEAHIDSLHQIQASHGTDSLFNTIGRLPIWMIDQDVAIEIIRNLEFSTDQYSPSRRYLFDISKHVESEIILEKLNSVVDSDLHSIRDSLFSNSSVLRLRKELLIAYYYQNQDQVFQSLSKRVDKLQSLLERAKTIAQENRRDIITRFIKGSSIHAKNVDYLTSNLHAIVSILHYIDPDQFTEVQIEKLEESISKRRRWVFQDFDLPLRSAKLKIFYSAKASKQSDHYLFNEDVDALDSRLDNAVLYVNVVYRNEYKKLVEEFTTYTTRKENLYYPSHLTTYLMYTIKDEVIELLIEDISYN